uniref:Uncharacterized protein n=1 Tax=Tanacetum cinerariifolium TaxID=118510 RepID=A0A699HFG5_TANCI|nr:hypothetical protein [Tanacetum cinerariifolium]
MHNNNLRTELDYFSKDYDEEREIEPRSEPARAVTPPLRAASPRVHKRRKRVFGFEETQNRGGSRIEKTAKVEGLWKKHQEGMEVKIGQALPNNVGGNLPHNAHELPSINSGEKPLYMGKLHQPSTRRPMYTFPNMPVYTNPNSTCLSPNPLGLVSPFVCWIEDYPLLDGLKMPSHIGSYDGKKDLDNFLHLFKRAIRMQKWLMTTACHMFTYTLKASPEYGGIVKKHVASLITKISKQSSDRTHLKVQIQEAINSGQLLHLVKGIKKEKAKENCATKNTVSKRMAYKEGIMFPPVTRVSNAPVIRIAAIFRRKAGRVYIDSGSICEVIYEHCFEKLNPTIKATRVNTKHPIVGFFGKRSWSVGEVPLEIIIGEHPLSRTKTLYIVIVKFDSPHNMLLGRTAMQKIGIVVSTIHGAIKFHTKKESEPYSRLAKLGKKQKRPKGPLPSTKKGYPAVMTLKKKSVAKWAIELGEHDIVFLKRDERETPANFLPEIPFDNSEKRVKEKEVSDPSNEWKLYTDKASSFDGAGAGIMLIDRASKEYIYALRFKFETTNKEAEYEALLARLRIAQEIEVTKVAIFLDSQLVVNQIKGTYAAKQLSIKSYLQKVKAALKGFEGYAVEHVRRNQNKKANALSKLASMTFEHLIKEVLVEVLAKRSIEEKEVLKVEIKEKRTPPQTDKIIKEIDEGSCGFNVKPRSMVVRIIKQGYYWPSMHREAAKIVQDCDKCKEQSAVGKKGMYGAITVRSTWPFSHWGIHILGPLPMAPGGLQFLAIAVEHSSKWVEAKPITVKNARQVEKFAWEYVVCRFGVPQMISSKEEKHFKEGIFADFCKGLKITQSFSPITKHMEIMHYIEKHLIQSQQSWVDNLAKELWVHKTLPKNSQEKTSFSITYGSKAIVPIFEAIYDRGRTQETTKKSKEIASVEKSHYRNKLQKYHNTRNNYSNYIVGDIVLFPTSSQKQ